MTDWFRPRRYRHFDRPVCEKFAEKVQQPSFVAEHSFSPFIHYVKADKRYKKREHKTEVKERPIMYASHRDACIYSWYSSQLNAHLEAFYKQHGTSDCVLAYRALGKGNYDFACEAHVFATANAPVEILAFDVTGFFDNLDHRRLKVRLKEVLGTPELPVDWYKVFRNITQYHYVDLLELAEHEIFGARIKAVDRRPLASVAELKAAAIEFRPNANKSAGIPQGTPISAVLSNLYMIQFDREMQEYACDVGGFYRRYSDDILFICKPEFALAAEEKVKALMAGEKLSLNDKKTERTRFDSSNQTVVADVAQYLGFTLGVDGVGIRPSSLSRQWRKMRRSMKRTRRAAEAAIGSGRATKVFTKRLRRRFTAVPVRNFPSYARRSAAAFEKGTVIRRQLRRLEREAEREIQSMKCLELPPAK
jgi:hypothetical protein